MSHNIYIIGFMGVGKTTIGRMLARRLEYPFLDTDQVFAELHQGMTTGTYICTFGTKAFRPEEQVTLRYIAEHTSKTVIATGGGVPTYENNLQIMKNSGTVIHILVPLNVIAKRMSPKELAKRPLWSEKSPQELQEFYDCRLAVYNRADYVINGNQSLEHIVEEIINEAKL